ncbi:p32K [Bovine adenovirus 7]|uniref:p32K protein n=1 Tax=Bovine adenovirus 7 TaxID=10511 RepID=A0A7R7FRJ2_ADEB7|nr:p32K [Bovine adenovirus 7]BCS90509.1 p32K [Bovine adenovirus 7]
MLGIGRKKRTYRKKIKKIIKRPKKARSNSSKKTTSRKYLQNFYHGLQKFYKPRQSRQTLLTPPVLYQNPPTTYLQQEHTQPISSYATWQPPQYDVNNISIQVSPPNVRSRNIYMKKIEVPEEEIYKDALDHWYFPKRPPDGENDSDTHFQKKMPLSNVINLLKSLPKVMRQTILTTLFGASLGLILDVLFGGPWNLTSSLFRLIISFVPGGRVLIAALDGLGYLLGSSKNTPMSIISDPNFQNLANNIQTQISPTMTEHVIKAAEEQIGGGFMRNLAAVFSAIASAGTHLKMALPAVPLAVVRPFR